MDSVQHPPGMADEKPGANHREALHEETTHEAAEHGHAATDQ